MLQQQNEELRARIEQNTVITRFVLIFAICLSLKGDCRSELPKADIYFRRGKTYFLLKLYWCPDMLVLLKNPFYIRVCLL